MMRVVRRPAVVLPLLTVIGFAAARMYAAPAPVSLTPSSKNFGNVAVGTSSAAQAFTLKNNQSTAIPITIAVTSEFTQTNNCAAALASKASCQINVKLAPTSPGAKSGTLTITGSSSAVLASASLTGTATTPVSVTPSSLSFGSQLIGATSAAKSVTITNNQSANLTGISSSI